SVEAFGRLSSRPLDLHALERWLDRPDDARCHPILQLEYVLQGTIEAIRPDVAPGIRIDELPGEAHPTSCLAHAPLEHIAHPELTTDLLHVNGTTLVREAGVARDDEQRPEARQRRDDFLDHAIGEVFL